MSQPRHEQAKLLDPGLPRGLQMACWLLAFNAEAWLAEHLNAYLADPNEYRAIMRNLLHLSGQIDYQPTTITLDRPTPHESPPRWNSSPTNSTPAPPTYSATVDRSVTR
jgi:hypothetical protein